MLYFSYFIFSAALAVAVTPLAKKLAINFNVLDIPNAPRRIHKQPIPLLGGLAVFASIIIPLAVYLASGLADFNIVPLKFFTAIMAGALVLVVGGILDDKYHLPPKILWLFPALASLIVVMSGIGVGIKHLSNPFGNPINLNYMLLGIPLSGLVMWVWMMGMIFTTKFLDGLDGLCAGITMIGGLTLFALSLTEKINQPITATLSIILAGGLFGYLFYAFNPASIFLGESGSTLAGFMLGVLSIILGGKIATALLVMGIPILDVAWVIIRRLWYGSSPFKADRKHLHFRLLDIGFSQRQSVLILYAISAAFGFTAVFLQSFGKLVALVILFTVMLILAISVVVVYKQKHPHVPDLFDVRPLIDEKNKI
ncbi:MAG: undecaprenyl/decaprenyl-phosphate alpha-N-acetylglucosaminyl 1-phosphate transferase [Patescibacteria group bacterium]|nr:undecaprenyl/decaprenyl-phosphate alpha-N-acetylglucosaminyl 1-phosphate transferase [Patescibacteria group bacterium]